VRERLQTSDRRGIENSFHRRVRHEASQCSPRAGSSSRRSAYCHGSCCNPPSLEPAAHDFHGTLRDAESTRRYGQSWAASLTSLAIYVPSVIIPAESNVLVNPVHDAFQDVVWDLPRLFEFDPRLLRGSSAML